MEKNHKNTDCYFFYYSTCTKGDGCAYRHEPSALGSETVCQYWQQGNCHNQHCNFRHMEIKKNRKVIPCYWEKFPAGCKKPHCPFLHKQTRSNISNPIDPVKAGATPAKPGSQEWANRPDGKFDGNSGEAEEPGRGSSFLGSPAVDPLIVNFEEASSLQTSLNLPPPPTQPQPPQATANLGLQPPPPTRSSLASSQSSPCHHRPFGAPPPPPHHHPPPPPQLLHNVAVAAAAAAHHHQARVPALSPMQPPPQPNPQPSSPLLQRPGPATAYPGLHTQQATAAAAASQAQAAASRFPFPFLSFASYRRF